VEFLHEEGIIHGDLCDRNILINGDGRAFVSGFGLSEFSNSTFDLSRARWLAPERVTIAGATCSTLETDIWTFGLLCLEVFTGEKPYNSYSDLYVPILLSKGTTPEHPGSTAVGLSPRMWELMQSCWTIDPAVRPSMSTIQSTICDILPPRVARQQSTGNNDNAFPPFFPPIVDSALPNEASHQSDGSSSPAAPLSLSSAKWGASYLEAQSDSIRAPHPASNVDRQAYTVSPFESEITSEASSLTFNPVPAPVSWGSSTWQSSTRTNESAPQQYCTLRRSGGPRPNPKVFSSTNDDLSPPDSETIDPKCGGKTDIGDVNDMLESIGQQLASASMNS